MAEITRPRVWLGADCMITSLGFSTEEALRNIGDYRGGCAVTDNAELYGEPFMAGLIDRERLEKMATVHGLEEHTRLEQLFLLTMRDVLQRSGVDPANSRTLLMFSTTKGNIDLLRGEGAPDERTFIAETAQRVADRLGAVNTPVVICNACISGVTAMIVGARFIREGLYDNVVVAGGDLVSKFVAAGFHAFKSVSRNLCRPYDAGRDGLTLGEGCAAVVLTSDVATAGENPIEFVGGAVSNDANHISGPSRTGDGLWFALRDAMAESGLSNNARGFINGHGTATVFNDEMESKAFALAGVTALPLNSLKPWFGHTLGASGVIETVISAHELRQGMVFGTLGFGECGTPHVLDISPQHRRTQLDYCIKTASGFGGCNAVAVLRKGGDAATTPFEQADVQINETAHRSLMPSEEPFHNKIRRLFGELDSPDIRFSKMDNLSKLAYVAVGHVFRDAALTGKYPPERLGVILANRSASLDTDARHQKNVDKNLPEGASPAVFVYTLPNVCSGETAIRHKIMGENTFFIQNSHSMDFMDDYARLLLRNGYLSAAIVGWCELLDDEYCADFKLLETKQK